ncbi:MAG: DNA polymerase IV [Clostridia bacterium]|nr:DNA polymerase IV [Clostridia bacterium]MBR0026669.1 DNA polymerase IV [Clostridia bacterium]
MSRVILHADFNAFYASAELISRPELRALPVAVAGEPEKRHGIILAKNQVAKELGVSTGEPIWQARQKAPGLVCLPPDFPKYERISRAAREVYAEYTPQVEPFGLDESWLDVSNRGFTLEHGRLLAEELRERIKREFGLTVSVGVANNKAFAKLGSDLKKPDAVTVLPPERYHELVWPLPAGDLLYVGRATSKKLARIGIYTIGDIANAPQDLLRALLGKWGVTLSLYARGEDPGTVAYREEEWRQKSISNSTTTPRDLVDAADVRLTLIMLSESVAARLRKAKAKCRVVQIHVRDCGLYSFERQQKLRRPTDLSSELIEAAMALFLANYRVPFPKPIRSVGVGAADLVPADAPQQLSLLEDESARLREERLERAIDYVRGRYGYDAIRRAVLLTDPEIGCMDPGREHSICFQRKEAEAPQLQERAIRKK